MQMTHESGTQRSVNRVAFSPTLARASISEGIERYSIREVWCAAAMRVAPVRGELSQTKSQLVFCTYLGLLFGGFVRFPNSHESSYEKMLDTNSVL